MAIDKEKKIYIAGHKGMVGSAILRNLQSKGYLNLVLKTREELDLLNQEMTRQFFFDEKPDYVFVAAAKVGGIMANSNYQAQFLYENSLIQNNIIHYAHEIKCTKLIFLGSACIYPRMSSQPIHESELLAGPLEPTNEAYAIAKIMGIKQCQYYFEQYKDNFISIMPNNLYGPNDNFNLETSHVLPALVRKFHMSKITNKDDVEIWGSGLPLREFLHVDDLAEAIYFIMDSIDAEKIYRQGISHINVGTGNEISILDLAELIKKIVGFKGKLIFDKSKPDGMPRKLIDTSFLNKLGWKSSIELEDGIKELYKWFIKNQSSFI